jgi:hypothetical protein
MRRVVSCIGVCLILVLVTAASAFAQQRLFVAGHSEIVEVDSRLSSLGRVVRRFPLPRGAEGADDVAQLGGGRFLIWANGLEGVAMLDTESGAVGRITSDDVTFFGQRVIGTDGNGRVVVLGLGGVLLVADIRSGRVRLEPLSRDVLILYASASDLLFVPRPSTTPDSDVATVDVIHASTGELLKTLELGLPSASAGWLSVNAAGTRLFVNSPGVGTLAFDVASGMRIANTRRSLWPRHAWTNSGTVLFRSPVPHRQAVLVWASTASRSFQQSH